MRITKQESRVVQETITQEVLCNKCTKSLQKPSYTDIAGTQHFSTNGIVEYSYKGGYDSDPLEDITSYTFSLYEPCLADLFQSFIIPVEVSEYDIMDGTGFLDQEKQERYNQIYESKDIAELANFLLDADLIVRSYAQIRIEQLDKK